MTRHFVLPQCDMSHRHCCLMWFFFHNRALRYINTYLHYQMQTEKMCLIVY